MQITKTSTNNDNLEYNPFFLLVSLYWLRLPRLNKSGNIDFCHFIDSIPKGFYVQVTILAYECGDDILFYFFSFIFISWRLITLQYCSGFCHTLT